MFLKFTQYSSVKVSADVKYKLTITSFPLRYELLVVVFAFKILTDWKFQNNIADLHYKYISHEYSTRKAKTIVIKEFP